MTYLQQLLPGKAMTQGRAYRDLELLRNISLERTRSGAAVDRHARSYRSAHLTCSYVVVMQSQLACRAISQCHADKPYVFAGQAVNKDASLGTNQQQQQQQRMILGEHTPLSLLDVESDMPLTFALDTQMLQLPLMQPPVSEGGWRKRFLDVAFGS